MKLQYKVLWFDDSNELFDSLDWDYLKGEIQAWGFVPIVDLVTTPEQFKDKAPYDDYDLLVVDFNLDGYGYGQDFIADVREQEVFTEIIFYSSGDTSLLWKAILERKLEGIYIANKHTILERILRVGQQSLRKVLDLDNMRGIVMAEVGDLDHQLNDILMCAMKSLPPETQSKIYTGFYEASSKFHASNVMKLDAFKASPTIEDLLSLCDSDKRWANYGRLKRHHKLLKELVLGNYVEDILKPRNFLAHGIPEVVSRGQFVFRHQGREYEFNDQVSTKLRHTIILYKKALAELYERLSLN